MGAVILKRTYANASTSGFETYQAWFLERNDRMTKLTAGLVDVGLLSSFSTVIGLANTPAKGTSTVSDADMIGIEELHQQDVAATLSGDPQQLSHGQ